MTPERAARHYAASLLEQQLAAAHVEGEHSDQCDGRCGRWDPKLKLTTFEKAPPNVKGALERGGLDGDAVAEAMAKLAEELRSVVDSA